MCKRKPGPRCSNDSRRNLARAHTRYTGAKAKVISAAEANRPNTAILQAQFQEAKASYKISTYEYYSTPEGFKRLENYIATEPLDPDQAISFDEGFVRGKNTADELRIIKDAAVAHREWQNNTLKALDNMRPREGSSYAKLLKSSLEKKSKDDEKKLNELIEAENTLVSESLAVSSVRRLLNNSIFRARVESTYQLIQIRDLEEYTPEDPKKKKGSSDSKEETGIIEVAVKDLKPGDEIEAGRILKVTSNPKTPQGKKEVTYQDHAGNKKEGVWSVGTKVKVLIP